MASSLTGLADGASVIDAFRTRSSLRRRSPRPPSSEIVDVGIVDPKLAGKLCELARTAVDVTADLDTSNIQRKMGRTPRGMQHRGQVGMYLAHVAFGVRTSDVARNFHRDTTTVYHAYRQIEDMRDDPALDTFLDAVEAIITTLYELATTDPKR